ncbi:hypothetical protein LSTR_LSTR017168 [Laodelphax striatellus]|uniref:Uncharacterized protein n=1 Tax=Laodelphax striatellus TaxID=195883 RepID=A0A482XK46_LAOST|nr:hypothetical protein LSTR_LSTR017168 [Laodelphax striatellus]
MMEVTCCVTRLQVCLLLWPVSSRLSCRCTEAYFPTDRTMMELRGNTVCPFTITMCQTNKMSDKIDNSLGRCMKGRECVQGTSTIVIEMPNGQAPVTKTLYTGCFCVSQTASSPKPVAKPGVDRT